MKFLIAVITSIICSTLAVETLYDELLWIKSSPAYPSYKLDFPWAFFSKREKDVTRILQGSFQGIETHSLNGPHSGIATLIAADIKRLTKLPPSSFELTELDDKTSIASASSVCRCKVCLALTKLLWEAGIQYVHEREHPPSKEEIVLFATEVCKTEIPVQLLRSWMIVKTKVPATKSPVPSFNFVDFFMLTHRSQQHATPEEIQAIETACEHVVKSTTLVEALKQSLDSYEAKLAEHTQTSPVAVADAEEEEEDSSAFYPHGLPLDRSCYDRHPQCEYWASIGECSKNPKYMVKQSMGGDGSCRKACKVCTPAEVLAAPQWEIDTQQMISTFLKNALEVLLKEACVHSEACSTIQNQKELEEADTMSYISAAGTRDTGPLQNRFAIKVPMSKSYLQSTHGDEGFEEPIEDLQGDLAIALWNSLANSCIYSSNGWWQYELCPWRHIKQFHLENNEVENEILLGRWQSSDWVVKPPSQESLLYQELEGVPFINQYYLGGQECEELGNGMHREVVVRFMCNALPDEEKIHMSVYEPKTCSYLVEVAIPELCKIDMIIDS